MTISDQLLLALQAYAEIQSDLPLAGVENSKKSKSTKTQANIFDHDLLPDSSLLLGIAEDGFPVLLNLNNPIPGPILVAGGRGSGKTNFLQFLAKGSELLSEPGDTQFTVITHFPEEWESIDGLPNSLGIWPAYYPSSDDLLSRLISWTEMLPDSHQFILLLIDDLDLFGTMNPNIRHDLHWLFKFGPEKHIWPVTTVDPSHFEQLTLWTRYFHTQVFGRLNAVDRKEGLLHPGEFVLENLKPGVEFAIQMLDDWLKFSIPAED